MRINTNSICHGSPKKLVFGVKTPNCLPPGGTNLAQEMKKLKAVACPIRKLILWLRQSSQISALLAKNSGFLLPKFLRYNFRKKL